MKYFILIRDNKIINSGIDYQLPDILKTYTNIDESKTYKNIHSGGNNEILYLYTK